MDYLEFKNEMRHSAIIINGDEEVLMHSNLHKYLERFKKNGKWVYVYAKNKAKKLAKEVKDTVDATRNYRKLSKEEKLHKDRADLNNRYRTTFKSKQWLSELEGKGGVQIPTKAQVNFDKWNEKNITKENREYVTNLRRYNTTKRKKNKSIQDRIKRGLRMER